MTEETVGAFPECTHAKVLGLVSSVYRSALLHEGAGIEVECGDGVREDTFTFTTDTSLLSFTGRYRRDSSCGHVLYEVTSEGVSVKVWDLTEELEVLGVRVSQLEARGKIVEASVKRRVLEKILLPVVDYVHGLEVNGDTA